MGVLRVGNWQSRRWRAGQAMAEYGLLLATAAFAVSGMALYSRRSLQSSIKFHADQLDPAPADKKQVIGMLYETGDQERRSIASGKVRARNTRTESEADRNIRYQRYNDGQVRRTYIKDEQTTRGRLGAGGISSRIQVVDE